MAIGGNNQTLSVTIGANMDPSGVLSAVKQMQSAFSGLKLPGDIGADLEKSFGKATDLLKKYQTQLSKGINTKTDAKNITKTGSQINEVLDEIVTHINSINGQQIFLKADVSGLNTLKTNIENARTAWKNAIQEFRKGSDIEKVLNEIAEKTTRSNLTQGSISSAKTLFDKGDLEGYRNALDDIYNRLKNLKDTTIKNVVENLGLQDAGSKVANLDQIKKRLEDISKIDFSGDSNVDTKFKAITTAVTEYETEVKRASQAGQNAFNNINVDKTVKDTRDLVDATDQYKNSVMSAKDQVQQLQQSTQYFFSLRNMINLLKRGISDAVQTVKELDKAMTETAVVTDFSVGDMWAKLPEYTANANKLGATIQDMYESTTLYYQQGLNTQQSMAIATETMKMARIAGLEAKDATDMMTAALRGFNMELNETSAERINDVYSNLAAKTASDTEEIGKAMQRTASIAHSAGMSFEGTAAFLAQAVETTREPAENIGTAMKTIVARFQEMKKNPLEITEVDGEEVSYNKVDEALQSIGVSLKDANGQFRELDKVFLDISKRWDSLSQTQQRYIATIAAGSRQQSRFIAMMGDYDRTVELMSYANNSAGASQEQFNKTLDSLEAKINKFQNAWDQFLMGIMNDSWVKGLVDAGTTILKTVNNIIDALSFGGKAKGLKSLLSIGTAGVALKAGGNLINKLIGGLGGLVDPTSSFGKGFWGAGKTTQEGTPATGVAGKITTPIVAKLNELIAVTRKANNLKDTNTQVTSTLGQYKNVSAMLRNPNSLNMGDIRSLFGGLSDEHAYMAYKNTPGTVDAMRQAALGWLGSTRMPVDAQKTGQQLMSAIFKGMGKKEISVKDGMKLMGKPALWGEYFGTDVAKGFSQRYIEQFKSQVPEMKQKTQQAVEQTWQQLLGDKANNKAMRQGFLASQVGKDKFNAAYKNNRLSLGLDKDLKDVPIAQTNLQKFANTVGNFGSRMSAAGMSIQQFGIQLGQMSPALEGVGSVLVQIGGALSAFGMGLSGVGDIATKAFGRISLAITAAKSAQGLTLGSKAGLFADILTAGLSPVALGAIAATAVVGGLLIAKNIIDKKAREAGEEVRENFEKGFTETNKKIDSISDYKDRFNELSKGVDQFGHNINLTDEEFDEYLTISRELQELSPSLISGYNAEGQAILRKGAALDEVIDKLKEERDLSLRDYITDDSIGKLIGEYNTSDAYKNHNTIKMGDSGMGDAFETEKSSISKAIKEAELEWSDFSQILDELGIGGAESINDLTNQQLSMITAHYTDIVNKIKEFNPQIEEEAEDGLKEAFAETSNALEDVLTEGAPIVDALRQWMGQEKLDAVGLGLSEEFVSGFNSGLDGLMVEGLTNNWKSEEYKAQLRDYANEWEHLAGPTSTYANILSEADKIQQDYLDHIGEDGVIEDYENDVEGLATQLESLAEQYKGTGKAGEIFAEQCQQQANNLRNYATEGVVSLSEALNTLSDEFASARGAQERFQKATEGGDYYTAAEGYKSIIDTVLDDKNKAAGGSLTGWAGADELLGQDYVDNHNWNQIVNQIEKIQDCFADGADGVIAFNDLLTENADKLEGLGHIGENGFEFDLQNEDLEEYAKVLNMSEDALAALIDKARQWTPINLGNPGEIRKAIESSEYSMAGTSTKGESLVYTSESQFRAEARQQGIRGDDYTKTKSDAEERGVRFLNVENLTAKKGDGLYADQVLENIGLKGQDKTVENAVAAFTKMGLDLEDTKQVLMSDGIKLADGEEATAENIEKAYNEQAYELENPTVAGIANDTGTLVSNTSAMLAAMGILTEDAKKDIDKATSEETTQGYIDNLQNASSLNERNTARTTMEDKVSEYNALANKLVEAGRSETDPYVQKLRGAADALQTELDAEAKNWNDKAVAANQYLKENNIIPQGATTEEQQAIQMHAVDLQSAIETGDANTVIETLKQIETEGNLSVETMIALGQSVSDLGAVDSSSILHFISEYYEKLKAAREESNKPFEIETKFTGDKLEEHIKQAKAFTAQDYNFLIRADVTGEEKVTTILNSINQEFGNGDQETKTILIDAVAKTANGDKEGAHDILAEAFGEDKAETIEKKIDVLCDGSVANKDDVIKALESELKEVPLNITGKAKAEVSVESLKTSGNTMHYSTEVDTAGLDSAKKTAAEGAKLPLTVEDKASADIRSIKAKAGTKVSFDVEPNFTGTWTKTLTINTHKEHDARGRNYSIPAAQSLSFGSAAQGMNIPKKKQSNGSNITALVGEEGYEVGYIPSEGRSVIFGVNGPEMTSFPSDTIIYPHNQSKEILRRGKGIHKSLGSFGNGKDSISSGGLLANIGGGGGGSGSAGSTSKAVTKAANDAKKAVTTAAIKVGKVSVWWENIARKTESVQRKADQAYTKFEKYIKSMEATLKTTGTKGGGNAYIQNMSKALGYNQAQYDKANKQLKNLDKSKKKTTIKYKQGKKEKTSKVKLGNYIKYDPASGTYVIDQKKINKVAGSKKLGGKARAQAIKDAAEKKLNDKLSKRNKAEDGINKAKEALDKFGEQLYETFFAWEISLTEIWNLTQKIEAAQNKISRTDTMTDLLEKQLTSGRRIAGEDTAEESLQLFKERLEQQNQVIAERSKAIQQAQEDVLKAQTNTDEKAELEFIQKKLQDDAKVKASIENEALQKELQGLEAKSKLTKAEKDRVKKLKELIENNNKIIGDEESLAAAKRSVGETGLNETERLGYEQAEKETISKLQAIVLAKQFGNVTNNGDGTVDVNFDREALDQARLEGQITETEAKYIEEYYTKLTESSASLGDIINSLGEDVIGYHDSLINLQDQWADYESQLIQINEEKNRKELDNLKKLSDSVKQTLDQLLDDVKRKLDERRKQEDNAKTEQDISKKQQRLAALRADTSGGHQVEIAQLEKEIADAQQDYQRSLEDQLIDKLQYQADEAAKQRERQIQLQEELATTTNNIAQVQEWMANPSGHHDELLELYREQKGYYKTGEANQARIDAEFEKFYNGLLTNQKEQVELNKKLDTLTPILQDLITLQQSSNTPETINEDAVDNAKSLHDNYSFSYSQLRNDKGYTAEQFAADDVDYKGAREAFSASELLAVEDYKEEASGEIQDDYTTKLNNVKKNKKITTSDINKLFTFGKDIDRSKAQVIMDIVTKDQFTGLDPFTWKNTIKQLINADGITRYNLVKTWPNNKYLAAAIKLLSGKTHPNTITGIQKHKNYKNAKNLYDVYKTGGLADYTGPAWLDGTPSKPELVLNAKDTANFIALKDVLAKAMNSIGDTSNTYGDIMYEININVDKIEKDYDVDRVVDKVKKEIIKGAGYRNVTQVRNLR